MNTLTFRTAFGGPAVSPDYSDELRRIKAHLAGVSFVYELDLSMNIGGDMIVVTDPTGLRTPRVYLAKQRATGLIQVNSDDVISAKDPRGFLRSTIYQAVADLFNRIAAKDRSFDKDAELRKIEFLS